MVVLKMLRVTSKDIVPPVGSLDSVVRRLASSIFLSFSISPNLRLKRFLAHANSKLTRSFGAVVVLYSKGLLIHSVIGVGTCFF
jgi:hypothetical protein